MDWNRYQFVYLIVVVVAYRSEKDFSEFSFFCCLAIYVCIPLPPAVAAEKHYVLARWPVFTLRACFLSHVQVTKFLDAEVKPALAPFRDILGGTVELNV